MNTQNRQGGNDGTLDKGLDELGRKYRELEADTPPDLLDQDILNSAHRAVEKKPGWMQFGWLHGLATAAVIVLAFSIVMQQHEPIPVEKGIILDNKPPQVPGESAHDVLMRKTAPAAAILQEAEEAADSNFASHRYSEPQKEKQPLETMAGAPATAGELEVLLEEEKITSTQAKATRTSEADFAAVIAPAVSGDEDTGTLPPEQQLAEILRLKNTGDESWREALESFRQQYPDYPLPAELED